DTAPTVRWAWEFLRRNQEYRTDFLRIKRHPAYSECPLDQQMAEWFNCDPPALPGESLNSWLARVVVPGQRYWYGFPAGACAEKWGLIRGILPDPDNSAAWQDDDFEISGHMLRSSAARDLRSGDRMNFVTPITRHADELLTIFDLMQPIRPQINAAMRLLGELQANGIRKGFFENPNRRGRDPRSLLRYLRLLDAEQAAAEPREVTEVLYPNVSNKYPTFNATQRAKDDLKAAQVLRDRGYLYLRITWK
ncbi:MAG TPA: DUF2285 domain-containing protein, partial [Casimicrobiaceae bacterium]|nr:DUF2285 domain-containing protein [Casimicrobiaceae bacterium]